MQCCVVSLSEVMKDPNHTLSAKYWCDKKSKEKKEDFDSVLKSEQRKLEDCNE